MKDNIHKVLGSSSFSSEERAELDFYATHPDALNDLLEKEPWLNTPNLKILEPCAGVGNLADRLYELTGNKMDMYDIVSRRPDIIEQDYMTLECKDKYDVILTNFPYKEATKKNPVGFSELLVKSIEDVKEGGYVVCFMKLLQLESATRWNKIYSKYRPEKIYVYVDRRYCMKNNDTNKTDAAICYCWAIWHKNDDMKNGTIKTELDWIKYK